MSSPSQRTRGDEMLALIVPDQGPGLAENELENVSVHSYRPEFARQSDSGGTGLGLAMSETAFSPAGFSLPSQPICYWPGGRHPSEGRSSALYKRLTLIFDS